MQSTIITWCFVTGCWTFTADATSEPIALHNTFRKLKRVNKFGNSLLHYITLLVYYKQDCQFPEFFSSCGLYHDIYKKFTLLYALDGPFATSHCEIFQQRQLAMLWTQIKLLNWWSLTLHPAEQFLGLSIFIFTFTFIDYAITVYYYSMFFMHAK